MGASHIVCIQIIHTPIKGGLQIVEVGMAFPPRSDFGAKQMLLFNSES